jgi:hypothetical protein
MREITRSRRSGDTSRARSISRRWAGESGEFAPDETVCSSSGASARSEGEAREIRRPLLRGEGPPCDVRGASTADASQAPAAEALHRTSPTCTSRALVKAHAILVRREHCSKA